MTTWKDKIKGNQLPWLLEPDKDQPAVRYFALRDIMGLGDNNPEVKKARAAIMASGPVPKILAAQNPEGYWVKPGPGYGPKYLGTVWQIIFLAQLGADGNDTRVRAGCEYALSHNVIVNGAFGMNGTPSSFIHCMAGNLAAALIDLGWLDDARLTKALDWQARTVTGEGVAAEGSKHTTERYYKSTTSGPLFACGVNAGLPCAWGAIKATLAFSKLSDSIRTGEITSAIEKGKELLLSHDPALADYPFGYGNKPNSSWFKFGYPIGYITDVLQNLEVLASLGAIGDTRLANALDLVVSKKDISGRWPLEYSYNGKSWADIETKGQPSKWVTLRAIRVLKTAYPEAE